MHRVRRGLYPQLRELPWQRRELVVHRSSVTVKTTEGVDHASVKRTRGTDSGVLVSLRWRCYRCPISALRAAIPSILLRGLARHLQTRFVLAAEYILDATMLPEVA
jgi:hypothetical protein